MAAWPVTLPQRPNQDTYEETAQVQVVRTQMDVGPDFVRRRSTAAPVVFRMSMKLTSAQIDTLDAFYTNTLFGGVSTFTWEHPRTDAAGTFRFLSSPSYSTLGGVWYLAAFSVELLP